jgi:hypothetical protein
MRWSAGICPSNLPLAIFTEQEQLKGVGKIHFPYVKGKGPAQKPFCDFRRMAIRRLPQPPSSQIAIDLANLKK